MIIYQLGGVLIRLFILTKFDPVQVRESVRSAYWRKREGTRELVRARRIRPMRPRRALGRGRLRQATGGRPRRAEAVLHIEQARHRGRRGERLQRHLDGRPH